MNINKDVNKDVNKNVGEVSNINSDNCELEKINKINITTVRKNFILISINDNSNYTINLKNIHLPFGVEPYNHREIINIELKNNNNNDYNIYSHILTIENKLKEYLESSDMPINIKQNFENKTFMSNIKKSLLGYIVRTHINNSLDVYIYQKKGTKLFLPKTILNKSVCNIKLNFRGLWMNDTNYGVFITIEDVNVVKTKF